MVGGISLIWAIPIQAYQHIAVEVPPGQPDTGARSSRSEKAPKLPSMIVVDTVDRAD